MHTHTQALKLSDHKRLSKIEELFGLSVDSEWGSALSSSFGTLSLSHQESYPSLGYMRVLHSGFFMGFNKVALSGVSRYESPTFRNRAIQLTHMREKTQSRLAELPSLTLKFWGLKSLNSWVICHLAKANRYSFFLNALLVLEMPPGTLGGLIFCSVDTARPFPLR